MRKYIFPPFGDDPAVQKAMKTALAEFHPDLDYKPSAVDDFRLGSLLFKSAPALAVPYYKSSLDAMPSDPRYLTARRVTTDQLVMALGMSGDIKSSRAVAEKAIAADPEYPINYYSLACADAEKGNAADAKLHLQQAFDRKANVLKGEQMPDPTKEDSILKLKRTKSFGHMSGGLPNSEAESLQSETRRMLDPDVGYRGHRALRQQTNRGTPSNVPRQKLRANS